MGNIRSSTLCAALPLILGTVACSSDDPASPPDTYAITASKTSLTVTQDDSVSFATIVHDVTQNTDLPPQALARVSVGDDAKVGVAGVDDAPGTFRVYGKAPGSTTILLTYANGELSLPVTVVANPVASVHVDAAASTFPDSAFKLQPTLLDANGDTLWIRSRTFTSSDTTIATVSGAGVVTPKSVGTATITVEAEGKSAQSTVTIAERPVDVVTVVPDLSRVTVGGTVQLETTLTAANGLTLTGRTITYSSSNETVATVSESGLVTTHAPVAGPTLVTITATSEGKSGIAQIVVNP